jgi:hypothetical protein
MVFPAILTLFVTDLPFEDSYMIGTDLMIYHDVVVDDDITDVDFELA